MRTQCCAALQTGQCNDCPITAPMRPQLEVAAAPQWKDAPDAPGLWLQTSNDRLRRLDEFAVQHVAKYRLKGERWYGPISEDSA